MNGHEVHGLGHPDFLQLYHTHMRERINRSHGGPIAGSSAEGSAQLAGPLKMCYYNLNETFLIVPSIFSSFLSFSVLLDRQKTMRGQSYSKQITYHWLEIKWA